MSYAKTPPRRGVGSAHHDGIAKNRFLHVAQYHTYVRVICLGLFGFDGPTVCGPQSRVSVILSMTSPLHSGHFLPVALSAMRLSSHVSFENMFSPERLFSATTPFLQTRNTQSFTLMYIFLFSDSNRYRAQNIHATAYGLLSMACAHSKGLSRVPNPVVAGKWDCGFHPSGKVSVPFPVFGSHT